jgi:hypothetical protein
MSITDVSVTTYYDGFPSAPPAPPALSAALRGAELPRGREAYRADEAQAVARLAGR